MFQRGNHSSHRTKRVLNDYKKHRQVLTMKWAIGSGNRKVPVRQYAKCARMPLLAIGVAPALASSAFSMANPDNHGREPGPVPTMGGTDLVVIDWHVSAPIWAGKHDLQVERHAFPGFDDALSLALASIS
jgi:hypothetical protein